MIGTDIKQDYIKQTELREINIRTTELTGYMRCSYPLISEDTISKKLISTTGINYVYDFIANTKYQMMPRVISVRAGYFLNKAVDLLNTGMYDSCISIASGFSLLTSLIYQRVSKSIKFFDFDLDWMLEERENRLKMLSEKFLLKADNAHLPIDIFELINTKAKFNDILPGVSKPLFLIEGLSYFIPNTVFICLLQMFSRFQQTAIIFDYCPKNASNKSACYKNLNKQIPGFMFNGQSLFDKNNNNFIYLCKYYKNIFENDIVDIEKELTKKCNDTNLLVDINDYIPTSIMIMTK